MIPGAMELLLFASPDAPNPVDYVDMATNGGIVALLTYLITRGIPTLAKTIRDLVDMIRQDNFALIERVSQNHREAMNQVTTDRHATNNTLQAVVGSFTAEATQQRKHDAEEGKYEREACEKHIAVLSDSLTSSNLAVARSLDGLEQAVSGMVAVSKKVIDKKNEGTA